MSSLFLYSLTLMATVHFIVTLLCRTLGVSISAPCVPTLLIMCFLVTVSCWMSACSVLNVSLVMRLPNPLSPY